MNRESFKRPCMVICPGGGYSMCSERESEVVALKFIADGFNVFVINYSVAPHRFPTQLIEVAAVMELIYENCDEWNSDVSKIAIMGFSAGGHLAAHYSTAYDCDEVRAVFKESKPVNASVLCYPVITADPEYQHAGSITNLSGTAERTEEIINKFSCDRNVGDKTPPAYIWHTAEDNCVPVMNSILYASALTKHSVPYELHIFPHGPHGLSTVDRLANGKLSEKTEYAAEWVDNARSWLKLNGFVPEI